MAPNTPGTRKALIVPAHPLLRPIQFLPFSDTASRPSDDPGDAIKDSPPTAAFPVGASTPQSRWFELKNHNNRCVKIILDLALRLKPFRINTWEMRPMLALLKQTMVVYKNEYDALLAKIPSLAAPLQTLGKLPDNCTSGDLKTIGTSMEKACLRQYPALDEIEIRCMPGELQKAIDFSAPLPTEFLLYRYFMDCLRFDGYRPPFVASKLAKRVSAIRDTLRKQIESKDLKMESLWEADCAHKEILDEEPVSSFLVYGPAFIDAAFTSPKVSKKMLRLKRERTVLSERPFYNSFAEFDGFKLEKGKSIRRTVKRRIHEITDPELEETLISIGLVCPPDIPSDEERAYLEIEVLVEDPKITEQNNRILADLGPQGFLLGMIGRVLHQLVDLKIEEEKASTLKNLRQSLEVKTAAYPNHVQFPLTPVTLSMLLSLNQMAAAAKDFKQLSKTKGKGLWRLSRPQETLIFEPNFKPLKLPAIFFGGPGYLRPRGDYEKSLHPSPAIALAEIFLSQPFLDFSLEGVLLWLYMLDLCLETRESSRNSFSMLLSYERFLKLRREGKRGNRYAKLRTQDYSRLNGQFKALALLGYETHEHPGWKPCFFEKGRFEPVEKLGTIVDTHKSILLGVSEHFFNELQDAPHQILLPKETFFSKNLARGKDSKFDLLAALQEFAAWICKYRDTIPNGVSAYTRPDIRPTL
jgi:hypothetical protein